MEVFQLIEVDNMNTVVITTKSHDSISVSNLKKIKTMDIIGDTIFNIDRRDIMSVLFK